MNYTVDTLHLGEFTTESGETIENLKLRYEHVGYKGQPLVLICHALTGNHLTYGTDDDPGWWREIIDGGYMPVHDYQFLTFNVIGSPFGSSSALTERAFPERLTIRDIVRAIEIGISHLGFKTIDILIGASLGGMQAIELLYNNQFNVKKAVILASTCKTSSYSRAFNEIARQSIHLAGKEGLSLARQIGFLTYRSSKSYEENFTPEEVVSYQKYQGDKFKERFDLKCYLTLLDVLDSHNIDRGREDVDAVFKSLETKVLTVGFKDDLLYPNEDVYHVGKRFKYHRHFYVPDNVGHDGFLLNFNIWAPNLYHFLKVTRNKRK
ncbi:homoserine O-acetyltransferase MetX [Staphylococcus massiliensis]|uniref:Homoserine O-acetyltransferase n=1 Tax=Staphylococcus massiliensis S46 TaxID=1229783 RepID=K9ALH5_9STAP|nr:alpha/beta fold hydrolase family protein [Staphylococcus massiliensis]EKU48154.1 homoserine O-acetyltransferase [Staphylococcus massiliensis S46]MCG3399585.1 alpha/beta fold hydrolase family protein [Staphylococcus massiliensis]MCG3402095.1 alpha/beta fold hydrolase family protein [Staphylococcus massiliensis]MCG3412954.1 alpha/beta fold hydrolase family protein [Staphylococcus massiliensis]POA00968.1 homoserine acetyltransferase [Staphylococcus massiliensis CCUG 55927]